MKPDDLYIMLTDADMSFLSPIHPLVLFDHKNGRYLPRVHAASRRLVFYEWVWGRFEDALKCFYGFTDI